MFRVVTGCNPEPRKGKQRVCSRAEKRGQGSEFSEFNGIKLISEICTVHNRPRLAGFWTLVNCMGCLWEGCTFDVQEQPYILNIPSQTAKS